MDKGKKGSKKKTITINKNFANKLGGKNYFIESRFCGRFLDCDSTGEVFLNDENIYRNNNQKWGFNITNTPGVYLLKNVQSELYLTTSEKGDLFAAKLDEESTFQKWAIMQTSEDKHFILLSLSNDLVLFTTVMNEVIMSTLDKTMYEDCSTEVIFKIYPLKPKK